jgi:sugar (pentulose or hexulose) kinase
MAQNKALPTGATVASLGDYVLSALSPVGQSVRQVVEPTMAASHGSMDVAAAAWHAGILSRLGLDSLEWPEIVPATAGPVYTLQIGERTLPCYPVVGDHQCAVLGALVQPGELSLNISTGSQVSLIADSPASNDAETRPFFEGRFLRTMTRIPAGRALNVLVNLLTELSGGETADSWQKIAEAVERTTQTDLRVDLSFFASETGDHGAIENIREDNLSVGHLFRASFVTMADNYLMCARRLGAPHEWQRLVFSGGLAQKLETLRAEIQQRFDLPYRVCPTSEDTLLGLIALGRRAYGFAGSLDEVCAQLLVDFQPER